MNASKTTKTKAKGKSGGRANTCATSGKTQAPHREYAETAVKEAPETPEPAAHKPEAEPLQADEAGEPGNADEAGEVIREPADDERLAEAEDKILQLKDQYLRVNAEFENYKKRMIRENSERFKYYNLELVKQLLPSIDNLERAISHAANGDSSTGSMIEGLELVYKEMQEVFGKFGVTKIKAMGETFDPNCHQAVGMVESDEVPENHVAEECLTGYWLHDRIIRPTMVRVSGKG